MDRRPDPVVAAGAPIPNRAEDIGGPPSLTRLSKSKKILPMGGFEPPSPVVEYCPGSLTKNCYHVPGQALVEGPRFDRRITVMPHQLLLLEMDSRFLIYDLLQANGDRYRAGTELCGTKHAA